MDGNKNNSYFCASSFKPFFLAAFQQFLLIAMGMHLPQRCISRVRNLLFASATRGAVPG